MRRSRDGLYRRGGVFAFRFRDTNGCWREKFTGETERQAAKRFKEDFERNLREGTLPTEKAKWTVEQACSLWVEDHAAHLSSAKARANEKSYVRQLIRRLGTKTLQDVTLDDLKAYQRKRRKEVRERPVNIELQILVNTLKDANLWRGALLRYKRLKEPESDIGQALSPEQLRLLEEMAVTQDAWQVAYWAEVLAANTGVRGGEIKKLRLAMLDVDNARIYISRDSTKTNAGARIVELNQRRRHAAYKLLLRAHALGAIDPDHYLLPADLSRHTKKGDPLKGRRGFDPTMNQMSWNTAWRALRRAVVAAILDKAKQESRELTREERHNMQVIQHVRFQDLRHTFITRMAERGVPLAVVQSMVGHMTARMTSHYTHISSQVARQAVELLDEGRFVGDFVGKAIPTQNHIRKLLN